MRLPGLGERKPVQLSGGQRQRVALARAIVNGPPVLLLDEPLGALDLKLRQEMQVFLKALQRDLGITFVYVTHDQEEALTMSDRLAVFNEGRIEQVGTPAEVYEHPQTEFVAGFVGVSNVLERDGRRFTIRPEKIRMRRRRTAATGEPGVVREVVYVGMVTRYIVDLDAGGELVVVRQNLETSSQEALAEQGQAGPPRVAAGAHVRDRRRRAREKDSQEVARAGRRRGGGHSGARTRGERLRRRRRRRRQRRRLPTTIGKGEGSLNVIEWADYTDKSFAQPFEKQTGCNIHRKDAGTSNQMVALMHANGGGGGGQYDLVSASGDASLRLIYAGDVQPININLIPSWKDFLPAFKSPAHNTVDGKHYGVSLQWGPNTLHLQHEEGEPGADGLGRDLRLEVQGQGHGAEQPDPDRGRGALPDADEAEPRDQGPVRADEGPARGGYPAAHEPEAAAQALLELRPRRDRPRSRTATSWMGAGWPYQTLQLQADKQPIKEIVPLPTTGWADTWMLAAKAPASELRLQVDAVRDDAQGRGAAGARLRRDAGQPARVPVHGQDPEGLVRGLPPERSRRPTTARSSSGRRRSRSAAGRRATTVWTTTPGCRRGRR